MPADLILYGLVAAGLVFWLKSILGTRHGDERERPDPFAGSPKQTQNTTRDQDIQEGLEVITQEAKIEDLAAKPTSTLGIDNKAAETALMEIAQADRNFDITFFLEAAQDVFVMVVEGFGKGDRETLEDLLSPEVYKAFDGAIKDRDARGETLFNEIHAIRKSEVIGAKLQGRWASVTVRFVADETSVTRNKDDEIIAGHPDRTTTMRDVWTFSRDIKSRDPRWLVTETREDVEGGDNDTIPNTH